MSDEPAEGDADQRWCRVHQTQHPIGEFYKIKDARYAGGYRYQCKARAKQQVAEAHRNAPEGSALRESIRKANRKYTKAHPEQNRAKVAAHRARKKAQEGGNSSE
jgi:hypothetical protein